MATKKADVTNDTAEGPTWRGILVAPHASGGWQSVEVALPQSAVDMHAVSPVKEPNVLGVIRGRLLEFAASAMFRRWPS